VASPRSQSQQALAASGADADQSSSAPSSQPQPPQPQLFLFVRRALCVVSRHAFVPQFRSVLTSLYRLFAVPPSASTASASSATAQNEFSAYPLSQSADAEYSTADPFSLKAYGFSPSASAASLLHPSSSNQARVLAMCQFSQKQNQELFEMTNSSSSNQDKINSRVQYQQPDRANVKHVSSKRFVLPHC
jgi:hypothetical protein